MAMRTTVARPLVVAVVWIPFFALLCTACAPVAQTPGTDSTQLSFLADEDMVSWLFECVVDAGYSVELVPNLITGRLSIVSPDTNTEAAADLFGAAMSVCRDEAIDVGLMRPVGYVKTEAEWRAEYDDRLRDARCLRAAGYAIEDPPSLEAYIDDDGMWSAHSAPLQGLSMEETQQMFQLCPQ